MYIYIAAETRQFRMPAYSFEDLAIERACIFVNLGPGVHRMQIGEVA